MKRHVFYGINTYQLSMKKLLEMNPLIKTMPITYTGFNSLNDYANNTTKLVTFKNNIYQLSKDPVIHSNLQTNFNDLRNDRVFCEIVCKNDAKLITVSYRIACFLMKHTVAIDLDKELCKGIEKRIGKEIVGRNGRYYP